MRHYRKNFTKRNGPGKLGRIMLRPYKGLCYAVASFSQW
jgi:hypothetical protein